jgi:hypothetical protein
VVVKSGVFLQQLIDHGVVLVMRGSISFTLNGAADLFLQNGYVASLLLGLQPPRPLQLLLLPLMCQPYFLQLQLVLLLDPCHLALLVPFQLEYFSALRLV